MGRSLTPAPRGGRRGGPDRRDGLLPVGLDGAECRSIPAAGGRQAGAASALRVCVATPTSGPQRLNSLRKKSETVIPNLGVFSEVRNLLCFQQQQIPHCVRDDSFASFSANCKATLNSQGLCRG